MKDAFGHLREKSAYPENEELQEKQKAIETMRQKKLELNRAHQTRRDTDDVENEVIEFEDIDGVILYQFNEKFNFHVTQNGERIQVPIIYDAPERWVWAAQRDELKTVKEKVIFPLIVFKRTSHDRDSGRENMNTLHSRAMQFNREFGNSFIGTSKYSDQNIYDNFSVLNGRVPVRDYYVVRVPNYVTVSYEFTVYTEYVYQMNDILEQISYMSNDYWGNPEEHMFKTRISGASWEPEDSNDTRYIRGSFSAEVNAYLLPSDIIEESTTKKVHSVAKVVTNERIVRNIEDI